MNATTTVSASTKSVTNIICRIDPATNKPVVFITDTLDKGQMLAWSGEEPEIVGIDYYQNTDPLSERDRKALAQRYSKAFGGQRVYIRERLPRSYKDRPDVLSKKTATKVKTRKYSKRASELPVNPATDLQGPLQAALAEATKKHLAQAQPTAERIEMASKIDTSDKGLEALAQQFATSFVAMMKEALKNNN